MTQPIRKVEEHNPWLALVRNADWTQIWTSVPYRKLLWKHTKNLYDKKATTMEEVAAARAVLRFVNELEDLPADQLRAGEPDKDWPARRMDTANHKSHQTMALTFRDRLGDPPPKPEPESAPSLFQKLRQIVQGVFRDRTRQ